MRTCVRWFSSELQRPVRLAISIEENRQNAPTIAITVRVRNVSGQAMNLAGHVLHVVVLNRKVEIPDLPRRIPNSNGETVFYDAVMKMLPSASGTALSGSLAPGQEQSFQFTYQLGTGELWPAGQDYVTAFVQNTSTREVIDAGTNLEQRLTLVRVQLAAPSPQFAQVPRSQQITRTLTLRNLNDRPYSFRLLVDASASLVPQGWSVSIAPDSVEIPAGQSQQFTLRVSTSARAEYAHLVIKPQLLSTQSGAILELRDTTVLVGLLSENTRYVAYWGANNWFSSVYWQPGKQLPAIGQDFAPLPLLPEVMEAFPMRQFQLAILPMGTVPLRAADGSLDYIWNDLQQALQAGTRVYIAANAGLYWAFDPNSTNRLPDVQSFFRTTLGIQYTRLQQRFTQSGGNVYLSSFPISGVAGDSIGDGITATANTSTSFYNLYTDIFATTAGSPARAVFYYDNTPSALGGVRVILPSGARVVYTSFGPEAIANGQLRLQILDRIVTWLLGGGGQQAQPRISLSAYSIRFDTTQVGQRSVQTLTISNTGEGTLRIQQIELQGQDASAFNVPDRDVVPIVLDPGQETQLDIEFRPTREGFHSAQMVLRSNDPQEPQSIVLLSGTGTVGLMSPSPWGSGSSRIRQQRRQRSSCRKGILVRWSSCETSLDGSCNSGGALRGCSVWSCRLETVLPGFTRCTCASGNSGCAFRSLWCGKERECVYERPVSRCGGGASFLPLHCSTVLPTDLVEGVGNLPQGADLDSFHEFIEEVLPTDGGLLEAFQCGGSTLGIALPEGA
jgi:hypothetical protein